MNKMQKKINKDISEKLQKNSKEVLKEPETGLSEAVLKEKLSEAKALSKKALDSSKPKKTLNFGPKKDEKSSKKVRI